MTEDENTGHMIAIQCLLITVAVLLIRMAFVN